MEPELTVSQEAGMTSAVLVFRADPQGDIQRPLAVPKLAIRSFLVADSIAALRPPSDDRTELGLVTPHSQKE